MDGGCVAKIMKPRLTTSAALAPHTGMNAQTSKGAACGGLAQGRAVAEAEMYGTKAGTVGLGMAGGNGTRSASPRARA